MDRIYLSPPHMSQQEKTLLIEAFDSNWIAPLGPHVDALENEFASLVGVNQAVALSCGTAGLHLALLLLGVGRGDEVFTSTMTFAATANAITYVGAEPVFIDSDEATWNMDPHLLLDELRARARRNKLPKAVVCVDLYGQCADYGLIRQACEWYNVPIIEDAAESLGATYDGQSAGTFGQLGIFSFNGNKIITASGGGMLVCSSKETADRARFLATQARDPAPHYQHSEIGFNYRMSNLLAAVGRGQLRVLEDRVQRRRENFEFYRDALADVPGVDFMPEHPRCRSTRWLTCATVDPKRFGATREDVRLTLNAANIESRPTWKPMHLQPVFAHCRACGGAVAERLFEQGLCLPSGSNLTEDQLLRIVNLVRAVGHCEPLSRELSPVLEPRRKAA
ncbi:MAG: aminotransferase class I/II-fold pyridoxal phosphate-dependent enzyme [Thermoguttaceae bacterium]